MNLELDAARHKYYCAACEALGILKGMVEAGHVQEHHLPHVLGVISEAEAAKAAMNKLEQSA